MKPEQVTDEMTAAAHPALYAASVHDLDATDDELRATLAAALTAMPDDLLRELVRERGCVMVDPKRMKDLIGEYWNIAYREGAERRSHDTTIGDAQRVWGEICSLLAAAETPAKEADHD